MEVAALSLERKFIGIEIELCRLIYTSKLHKDLRIMITNLSGMAFVANVS
jgi:hypothetical protein